MATLAQMIPRIFKQAWDRYGRPSMYLVPPIDEWPLPAGWSYDQAFDGITDELSYILNNPEDYWVMEDIHIVPTQRTPDMELLTVAGVVPGGSLDVFILDSDAASVREAHAVQLSGQWFDVVEVGEAPPGTSGLWARVSLRRRS